MGGRHLPGGRYLTREEPAKLIRRFDDGAVSGNVGLRGQHIHCLRARNAGHDIHGQRRDVQPGQRFHERFIPGWCQAGNEDGIGVHFVEVVGLWRVKSEHYVSVVDGIPVDDLRARVLVLVVRVGSKCASSCLNEDGVPQLD